MKRFALLPVSVFALAACSDAVTTPSSGAVPRPLAALTISSQNAPNGAHIQRGAPDCEESGGVIECASFEIAGVGNANARADLHADYQATVDCRNHGGKVVPVKASVQGASATTGLLEPKNGRLAVPALSTEGLVPDADDFTENAVCPNGNWTKLLRDNSIELTGFVYTVTFAGFSAPYITITD